MVWFFTDLVLRGATAERLPLPHRGPGVARVTGTPDGCLRNASTSGHRAGPPQGGDSNGPNRFG